MLLLDFAFYSVWFSFRLHQIYWNHMQDCICPFSLSHFAYMLLFFFTFDFDLKFWVKLFFVDNGGNGAAIFIVDCRSSAVFFSTRSLSAVCMHNRLGLFCNESFNILYSNLLLMLTWCYFVFLLAAACKFTFSSQKRFLKTSDLPKNEIFMEECAWKR